MRYNKFFGWAFILTFFMFVLLAMIYDLIPEASVFRKPVSDFLIMFLGMAAFSLFLRVLGMPRKKLSAEDLARIMLRMGMLSYYHTPEDLIKRISKKQACAIVAFAEEMGFKIPKSMSALETRAYEGRK